ncbi:MAG: ArsR family transcriptional regulator [Phycisphaerales bacterium]|nr:ArsR family transcriptional regulator [Phycisphaerales bacterium]
MREAPQSPEDQKRALLEAQDGFIAAFGQMGSAWGISRTMAEVQALLYITGEPLCTDDIMERLRISRGNASMSLRALLDWGVISRAHKRGDRKEYFQADQDVWDMFRAILRERMKREVDPLLASLHEIRDKTNSDLPGKGKRSRDDDPELRQKVDEHNTRLDSMLRFFETVEALSQKFVSPAGRGLKIAATLLTSPLLTGGGRER